MRKYVKLLASVLFIIVIVAFVLSLFSDKKVISYKVDDVNVEESYIEEENNYYFKLNFNNKKIEFKIENYFKKGHKIIDKIYSFKNDNYVCLFPMFDNNIYTDILCVYENVTYPYRVLANQNLELDKFAKNMEDYGYIIDAVDMKSKKSYGIDIYTNNLLDDNVIIIPSYKGLYLVESNDINLITLFNKDVYNQSISALVSDYYLVADYDNKYSFYEFYLINLKNNKVTTLASNTAISMNSYVQGVVDDSVYIIDRSNKKQYVIDIFNNSVSVVGNSKKGIKYYENGEFINKNMYSAINNDLVFKYNYIDFDKYDYVFFINGIYYLYLKKEEGYDVYISYNKDFENSIYGFHVEQFDKVFYTNNSVYYILEDTLYNYTLLNGNIPILKYSEFMYNNNLNLYIYEK